MSIAPALERELEAAGDDGEDILDEIEAREREYLDRLYPKPSERDITEFYIHQKQALDPWRLRAERERTRRYMRDTTPEKWQKQLNDGRRFYSRLTHNEINRVVGAQTANSPKVLILPAGDTPKAREAAATETRWANQLLHSFERMSTKPIRRRFVDCMNDIGRAAYEVYLTGAYDDLDLSPQMVRDEKGEEREETSREVMKRTDQDLRNRGLPFGLRYVDGLSVFYDEDEDGVCRAAIVERKPYRQVFEAFYRRGVDIDEHLLPRPTDEGQPTDNVQSSGVTTVETIRYYDRRWMAYIVGGKLVQLEEHGLPGVPVFPAFGLVTSSPNVEEQAEGICFGMESMELAVNDMMTLALDVQYTYSRPKLVIETPVEGQLMMDANDKPTTLDLSNENGVQQLNPGQKVTNVLQGFQPFLQLPLMGTVMNLWQRSGLNPIAQGESPGAAPAGYTVAALTDNATTVYEDLIRNEQVTYGRVVDFIRMMVKKTIKERVPLAAPVMVGMKTETEWLVLGPDDISETPCIVTIDPTTDSNRMAKRQSLSQGRKEGYVPRRVVQVEGYGAEDPDAWDDEILLDAGTERLGAWAIEAAMKRVQMIDEPPAPGGGPPGLVGPNGEPISSQMMGTGGPNSGMPAAPQAPTVGAELAAASGPFETQPGPASMPAAAALAGQGGNYLPPNRRE